MYGDAPRSHITGVPGWETHDEQEALLKLAQAVPVEGVLDPYPTEQPYGGTIVEIGAEFGMSASIFAHAAHARVWIVSVDLFPGNLLEQHRSNLAEAGFANRAVQYKVDSKELGKEWPTPIDLLFIDGDHTYEGVKADIGAWTPHVKKGGIVAFHDCACATNKLPHVLHFEVTRAVSEWFAGTKGKWRALDSVDSLMVFERVK